MKKTVLRAAVNAALALSAVLAVFSFVNMVLGYRPAAVASTSMSPSLNKNDLIFIEQADFGSLQRGDIITFRQPGTNVLVTHRIEAVSAETAEVYTRGEQEKEPDPQPVPAENIMGRYMYRVPVLGGLFY